MAELVRRENDLLAIRVSLGPGRVDPVVELEVNRGAEVVERETALPSSLGIPSGFDASRYRYDEPQFRLHPWVGHWINQVVEDIRRPQDSLWLHLASPAGYLPLLPWERMLAEFVSIPVLRVPNFALVPRLADDALEFLDIVICMSEPESKRAFSGVDVLIKATDALMSSAAFEPTLHVFTDSAAYMQLKQAGLETEGPDGTIHLYDPLMAPQIDSRGPSTGRSDELSRSLADPWLEWMIEQLRGRSIELVHFITHGYLSTDQPSLAVAESPTLNENRRWARFIGPNRLSDFLTRLGAWGVGFSSPPLNFSVMALRLLADRVAHLRAGPIVFHDLKTDPEWTRLADANFSLLTGTEPQEPSDMAMYSHPRTFLRTSPGDEPPGYAEELVRSAFQEVRLPARAPAWATSTRRYLEQSVARMFPEEEEPGSAEQRATGEGVLDAMRFVDELLEEWGSRGEETTPEDRPDGGTEAT